MLPIVKMVTPNATTHEGNRNKEFKDEVLNFSDVEDDVTGFSFLQHKPARKAVKRARSQDFPRYPRVELELNAATKRAKGAAENGSGEAFETVLHGLAEKELEAASMQYAEQYQSVLDTISFWWEQFQPVLNDSLKQVSMVDNTRNLKNETLCQQKKDLQEHYCSLQAQEKTWKLLEQKATELTAKHGITDVSSQDTFEEPLLYAQANQIEQLLKSIPQSLCLRMVELNQNLHSVVQQAKRSEVARNALLKQVDATIFKGYEKNDAKLLIRSLSAN